MSDLDDILDVRAKACHIFRPLAVEHPALRFIEFEGGVELRLRGATKADSFRRLLSGTPANTPVAYIGDDRLDNGSYRVLNDWRPAFFMRHLPNADATQVHPHPGYDVIRFLDDWIHTIRGDAMNRTD
jgi:trehalose-6-phosphatase